MRRFQIIPSNARQRRRREVELRPLLQAVETEAPPEGLLQSIERRIEALDESRPRARCFDFGWVALPVATAALAAWLLFGPVPERSYFVDPAGREVAHLVSARDGLLIRMQAMGGSVDAQMAWHLWGIDPALDAPVHVGSFESGEIHVASLDRFSGFAMSLEDLGFSGDAPAGLVVALTRHQ